MPDGSINYNCGCVSGSVGLLTGPCGVEFRELHQCLLTSESKGLDCGDQWQQFRSCFSENLAPEADDENNDEVAETEEKPPT